MAEPLKVILIVAGICSGLYAFMFVKNIALTGQVDPLYFFKIIISFAGVVAVGLLIWGIVALCQASARKSGANKPKARRSHV